MLMLTLYAGGFIISYDFRDADARVEYFRRKKNCRLMRRHVHVCRRFSAPLQSCLPLISFFCR